jgi:predicted enzyme related to lactoylglutathione lyase
MDTAQPDPEAASDFYRGVFGWVFEDRLPPEAPGRYFVARLGGRDVAAISSQPEGGSPAPVWNTYIWVDDADATVALVRDAGGRVITEPFDVVDAGRMAACTDASGAVFHLWQAGTHRGAQAVNRSVTFSVADTDAVAATAAELGGRVVTPPIDAGPVRVAVLSDRQGAVFSVNTYQPGEPATGAG